MDKIALAPAALAVILALDVAPAHAINTKSYVSSFGSNANTCATPANACATFSHAVSQTIPGGEVTVVDTGNYDTSMLIDRSISITNDGAGEASIVVPPLATGMRVLAGAGDVISLRGLVIDGQVFGGIGILFDFASALHIQNCVIRNFEGSASSYGIDFEPVGNAQLFISDSIVFNNGNGPDSGGIKMRAITGIATVGNANAVLDRVHLENNVTGLRVDGNFATGNGIHVVVRDSVLAGNAANGIHAVTTAGKAPAFAFVERSSLVNNMGNGILADGPGATVLLRESTITRNGAGVGTSNGGQLISFGNNANANNIGPEGTATGFRSAF